jgi:CPA2 family monovalent cation:H+ antiporter-2
MGTLLTEALIFVSSATLVVALFTRLGLPAVVGYLVAGLIIGPHGLHLLEVGEEATFLAELGVALLMFMVGLEFSFPALLASRTAVLGGGMLQVGLTVLAVAAGVALLLGTDGRAALLLGGTVAMSSTAITLKQLADQHQVDSDHGRLAVSILLFQDLATLPFLVALSVWQRRSPGSDTVMLAFGGAALLVAIVVSGPVLRPALAWVARTKSADLFLLATLLFALGAAYIVHRAGMPLSVGAFLAGMVISESDFRHQVADDVRRFRDVLLGLFFTTVGMQIDPSIIASSPWVILAWIMAFIPGKAFLTWVAAAALRWRSRVRLAVILAHGGEFGLLLLTQAIAAGVVSPELGQPVLAALAITMLLAPVLIEHSGGYEWPAAILSRWGVGREPNAVRNGDAGLAGHVLICGCGRIGRLVAAALEVASLAYVVVESDVTRFEEARTHGHRVVLGDAGRRSILDVAGLGKATLLVITFDGSPDVERVLYYARANGQHVPSLISVADERRAAALADLGATTVFRENLAAGLALAHHALLHRGFGQNDAARFIAAVREKLNSAPPGRVAV